MLKHAENRWIRQKGMQYSYFLSGNAPVLTDIMTELEVWLSGMGLSKFLPAFKREEFDMSSISEINDGVLLTLGLPQGARLSFLKAQREHLESQAQKDPHKCT